MQKNDCHIVDICFIVFLCLLQYCCNPEGPCHHDHLTSIQLIYVCGTTWILPVKALLTLQRLWCSSMKDTMDNICWLRYSSISECVLDFFVCCPYSERSVWALSMNSMLYKMIHTMKCYHIVIRNEDGIM